MYEDATGKLSGEQRAHLLAAKVLLHTAADVLSSAIAALTWAGVEKGTAVLTTTTTLRHKTLDTEFDLAEWLVADARRKA